MIIVHRTALRRRWCSPYTLKRLQQLRQLHQNPGFASKKDPRLSNLPEKDYLIEDDFAVFRSSYQAPKHPIILAHGLLGFNELHLAGPNLPGVKYWRGIQEALAAKGVEVITATVPPSGRIEVRAEWLAKAIEQKAKGKAVNIIAGISEQFQRHILRLTISSGLDSRHMISRLQPPNVRVLSLTTIATPHRGSSFAEYIFSTIGRANMRKVYKALEYFGIDTGAFRQLTPSYMADKFNPRTPDVEGVKYYSYGATMQPHLMSMFRQSHNIVEAVEGPNDGLVSVSSAHWGEYKGTLNHVSHLDLINWTNRLRWYFWELTGHKRNFNAVAFYLSIAGGSFKSSIRGGVLTQVTDMLAKEGL